MPSVTTVPGRWPLIGHTVTLLRSPVEFLSSLPARGDVVRVFLGPLPVHLVTTPELGLLDGREQQFVVESHVVRGVSS